MQAVARELVGRNVAPQIAGLCGLGQQVSDQVADLVLRFDDMLASMHECREFGLVGSLVGHARVCLEHRFELLANVASSIADLGEMLEVAGDPAFVPGEEDRSPAPPAT